MKDVKKLRKRILEYSFLFVLLVSIVLIYLAVAQQVADFISMSSTNDYGAVKEYLQSFGYLGAIIIAVLEMLQMIVVIVPAEFVQIAAGLAYPIYFAIPICVAGICMGASVIFLIVRFLHIRLEFLEKRTGKIRDLVHKINKSTPMTVIMYLLFVMPMIPFGAICYFASSSNISYKRYIGVVATGVIPSVLSSYVLGNVMYHSIGLGTGAFIAIVAVVAVLMVVLLLSVAAIIKNKFFPKEIKKPNYFYYHILYFFVNLFFSFKFKVSTKKCVKIKDKAFMVIGTHTCFTDFYFLAKAIYPNRINVVANRYFCKLKATRNVLAPLQVVPKNLFAPDVETAKLLIQAKKMGCNLGIFPEGRLSSDGASLPVAYGTANLIKKLALPIYFQTTVGGYFAKPKWRNSIQRISVDVRLEKLLSEEQIASMTEQQIQEVLDAKFIYDECKEYAKREKVKKNSVNVLGLENILYRCPKCGSEFKMTSTKNSLICGECGNQMIFDDRYLCDGKTISDYYREQKALLDSQENFFMQEKCSAKRFNNKKGVFEDFCDGVCTLTNDEITFVGKNGEQEIKLSHTPKTLQALAFSAGEEFEFYVDGRLYYFYPENREQVIKWSIIWDILQERRVYGEKKQGC